MKEKKERYFARLVIFAVAAVLIISSVAIMAYTADKEKPKLTTSFKTDVVAVTTPATPSTKSTDPIIWNNGGTISGGTLLSSQNDVNYPFVSQVADDFMFSADMLVTDVHWWGGFWNGPPDEVEPCPFYIYFYADDGTGNAPTGGGMGDPAPTALASYYFPGVSGLPLDPNGFYEYDVDLSPPFSAAAGVKYWVAIQADFPFPPQWGWTNTSGIQLHNAVQGFPFLGTPFWTDPDPDLVDMAYYLTGLPDEGEWPNHKMHFPQLPDEIGWDVNATYPKILADDWQCSETGYVTDIHFWGSWKDTDGDPWTDDAGHILYFIFSIHSNIPADPDTPWSRPGELLWERIDSTAITPIDPPTLEGWYDLNTDLTFYNDHVPYWRYDYVDIPDPFFQYQDSIYWLNISAVLEDTFYHWGWKNSRDHFMDDAVYRDEYPGTPPTPWIEIYEPPRANWFDVYFNSTGEPEDMGSTNHYGDGWYFYPLYNWWNMWFYDNPFVYNPKHIWLDFYVEEVGSQPYAEFAINWSTDLWSLEGVPDRPPLPGENEDLYIGRQQFEVVPGPNTIDFWITGYNPEWVSIDFRAQDVVINGWIWHECVRTSMDLAFVITGGEIPPDTLRNHYKTWLIEPQTFDRTVFVQDQFMEDSLHLTAREFLSNPVKKVVESDTFDIIRPNDHLTWYRASGSDNLIQVEYVNQFESTTVAIDFVEYLLVPTQKEPHAPPQNLDHYKAYRIEDAVEFPVTYLELEDQFDSLYGSPEFIQFLLPIYFLTPALKNMEQPQMFDSITHYVAYEILPKRDFFLTVIAHDQFGSYDLQVLNSEMLLVPSKKRIPQPAEEDFGDAPDAPYPTQLASNGARHTIVPGVFMGATIDSEADGQQSPDALGDDNDGNDDEDGVVFTTLAVAGNPATVKVTASVAGFLDAWVDFNFNGDWADAGENIFASVAVAPGVNFLTFTVPAATPAGITHSRFRFSTAGGLTYTGPAPDGEVEDYRVFILQPIQDDKMHWPQLPDLDNTGMDVDMYYAPLADDFLCIETGKILDAHIWGSFADDILPAGGPGALTFQVEIWSDVTAADNPYGPWSMPWELLCAYTFVPGEYDAYQVGDNNPEDWFDPATGIWINDNHLNVYQYDFYFDEAIACTQDSGTIYWLAIKDIPPPTDYTFGWKTTEYDLRWNDDATYFAAALGFWLPMVYPVGHEYQDSTLDLAFVITGRPDQPELDFGDAPDPTYPTLLATNGARHTIVPGIFLGASIDPEADGQQSADALGDDNDGNDDEDGVVFTTLAVAGNPVTVKVTASVDGFLDGWVDFNFDGDWADAGEQVSVSTALVAGVNSLAFPVPAATLAGITYSRFRFSTAGGLTYTGPAPDGEVEDYRVFILQPIQDVKMHWKQLPDLDNTGMDVDMFYTPLADDWMCTQTGEVRDIHFWGSFADDQLPAGGPGALTFLLAIHDNDPGPPSTPGTILWWKQFPPGSYVVNQVADNNPEDWYDPMTGLWINDNHLNAYQYDFFIEDSFFVQDSGTIYWLDIDDIPSADDYTFGWKTTEIGLRFMDDACYWDGMGAWIPMFYPPGHEYHLPPPQEETLDLAFVITGKPKVICGDVNANGVVDVGDVVYLVTYLYRSGPAPIPRICVGDVNNNDIVDVGDLVYLVTYLYKGGPAPDPDCCNPPWGK